MKQAAPHLLLLLCSLLLSSAGCSRTVVQTDNPSTVDAEAYRDYYDASIEVLRELGYVIDRRDYRFGTITTEPKGSPNVLEVWDAQNSTADQAVESTLSDMQRRVTVTLSKATVTEPVLLPVSLSRVNVTFAPSKEPAKVVESDDAYSFKVVVMLERKQVPTRRIAGSARRNVFSNLAAPPRELTKQGVTANYYEPVGRDRELEDRLIHMIGERVAEAD